MRSFSLEVYGHLYRAAWRLEDDDALEVRSPFGTVWTRLNGRSPAEAAREVLKAQVPKPQR